MELKRDIDGHSREFCRQLSVSTGLILDVDGRECEWEWEDGENGGRVNETPGRFSSKSVDSKRDDFMKGDVQIAEDVQYRGWKYGKFYDEFDSEVETPEGIGTVVFFSKGGGVGG